MDLRERTRKRYIADAKKRIASERDTLVSLFPPSQGAIAMTIDRLIAAYVDDLEHRLKD